MALKWKSCTSSNTNRAFFAKKIRNDFTTYILQSYKVSSNHQTKIPLAHLAFFLKKICPSTIPSTYLTGIGCGKSKVSSGMSAQSSPSRMARVPLAATDQDMAERSYVASEETFRVKSSVILITNHANK